MGGISGRSLSRSKSIPISDGGWELRLGVLWLEHQFWPEKTDPFPGLNPFPVSATFELYLSVGAANEGGRTKGGDDVRAGERGRGGAGRISSYHARILSRPPGHSWSVSRCFFQGGLGNLELGGADILDLNRGRPIHISIITVEGNLALDLVGKFGQ